jgi:hypothetical protein
MGPGLNTERAAAAGDVPVFPVALDELARAGLAEMPALGLTEPTPDAVNLAALVESVLQTRHLNPAALTPSNHALVERRPAMEEPVRCWLAVFLVVRVTARGYDPTERDRRQHDCST